MADARIKLTLTLFILYVILLSVGCSDKNNPTTSSAPVIDSLLVIMGPDLISGSALNAIPVNSEISLTCLASDLDDNAADLTFFWQANSGQFDRNDSNMVRWSAPDSTVLVTITVTVSDGANSVSENISLGVVLAGALSDGSVSPGSGNTDDIFVYEVIFTDPDNQPPQSSMVVIDDIPHVMSMVSGSYSGGALFRFESLMSEGAHRCYFKFIDSKSITAYFPQGSYLPDPFVTGPGVENGIVVNSEPAGASIYFDNTNMLEVTPYVIENVNPGQHHIRLYLQGYNEYEQYFDIGSDETIRINAVLRQPETPYPVIEIYAPLNETEFNDNVIIVSGLIQLDDGSGALFPFDNNQAILTLNNVDQIIAVNNGLFEQQVSIIDGENSIQLRASSAAGETGISENITVYGNFGSTDIEISLVWNGPNADLDLHIWNPLGELCFWGYMEITDGSLNIDDSYGYGPEIFTAPEALDGVYTIIVNCYNLKGDIYTDATIQVKVNGGPAEVYGPHRFTVSDNNGDPDVIAEAWWNVVELSISGVKIEAISGINSSIRNKIILRDLTSGLKPAKSNIR